MGRARGSRVLPDVALDVDGVLNALGPAPGPPWQRHRLVMRAETLPKSSFLRGYGERDLKVTVHVNPEHGAWIRELRERAEVMWCSTWQHAANIHLSPLLGIPAMPALDLQDSPLGLHIAADSAGAKRWDLGHLCSGGRPVVWVDDLADERYPLAGGRGLPVSTDPAHGLTQAEQLRVERFLDWAGTAGPNDLYQLDLSEGQVRVWCDAGHVVTLEHRDSDAAAVVWQAPGREPRRAPPV